MRLTEARWFVLTLCDTDFGHRPVYTDWQAIYWLHKNGLIETDMSVKRDKRRYRITPAGRRALEER